MNLANMKRSETTEQIGLINWARFVYWGNDCCYLMAGRRTSDGETEAEFWKYLEGTEIV